MKKLFLALTFICISLTALNAQSQKIAFVNTQLIMDTIPQTDSVQMKLAMESQKWQKKMQDLQAELQAKEAEFKELQTQPGKEVEIELLQKSYQRLYNDYQETQQTASKDIQNKQMLYMQPIIALIKENVGNVAGKKGYTQVVDNAAGIVIWSATEKDDITGDVIKAMLTK